MASIFGYAAAPEPPYTVLKKTAEYEVRQYAAQLRAYVTRNANHSGTSSGFRTLARYIFGGNTAKPKPGETASAASEKIGMTAPVAMTAPENIPMTAPVAMSGSTMSFIMPAKYTSLEQLPTPKDDTIRFVEIPPTQYAIIRFSGTVTHHWPRVLEQEKKLREAAARDGIHLSVNDGDMQLWAFNPPWTLPFFKRNEVAIPLAQPLPGVIPVPVSVPAGTLVKAAQPVTLVPPAPAGTPTPPAPAGTPASPTSAAYPTPLASAGAPTPPAPTGTPTLLSPAVTAAPPAPTGTTTTPAPTGTLTLLPAAVTAAPATTGNLTHLAPASTRTPPAPALVSK